MLRSYYQDAFATRFDLMHCVHTRMRRTAPFTTTRARCRLGYQRRGVLLFAWLTLCPVMGPLPQTAHTRAMDRSDKMISKGAAKRPKPNQGTQERQPRRSGKP